MKITMDYKQYQQLLNKVKSLEGRMNLTISVDSTEYEIVKNHYLFENEDTKKEFESLKKLIEMQIDKIHKLELTLWKVTNSYKERRKYRKHRL